MQDIDQKNVDSFINQFIPDKEDSDDTVEDPNTEDNK